MLRQMLICWQICLRILFFFFLNCRSCVIQMCRPWRSWVWVYWVVWKRWWRNNGAGGKLQRLTSSCSETLHFRSGFVPRTWSTSTTCKNLRIIASQEIPPMHPFSQGLDLFSWQSIWPRGRGMSTWGHSVNHGPSELLLKHFTGYLL